MTTEPSDRTIILHLLRGAVPERADEISGLWRQYGHAVEVAPSAKGVTMNADATRIEFDTKTIDLFWLLGFSAWRAIEVYSPALVLATVTGMPLDQAFPGSALGPRHRGSDAPDRAKWPASPPMPGPSGRAPPPAPPPVP